MHSHMNFKFMIIHVFKKFISMKLRQLSPFSKQAIIDGPFLGHLNLSTPWHPSS